VAEEGAIWGVVVAIAHSFMDGMSARSVSGGPPRRAGHPGGYGRSGFGGIPPGMMNASPVPLLILNRGLAVTFVLSSSTRRLFCSACAALAVSAFAASLASRALSSSRRCFFHPVLPLAWPVQAGGAACYRSHAVAVA
jgi:hypothetical protein